MADDTEYVIYSNTSAGEVIDRCPRCGGPLEMGEWTGALLCAGYASDHFRAERDDWRVRP